MTAGQPASPLVLIAENDAGVRDLYRYVLASRGLRVECVEDGPAALARTRSGDVTLLVCDLEMPGLRGQELLAQLEREARPLPAIVVSGWLDACVEEELRRYPRLLGIWRKPFDVFEFARRICELAGQHHADGAAR
jgi:CheY-like chemotaxis protein